MDPASSLLAAGILTCCIGGAIIACVQAGKNFNKPQPICLRCRCNHKDHEQRFGDPGHCHKCYCFRYERG